MLGNLKYTKTVILYSYIIHSCCRQRKLNERKVFTHMLVSIVSGLLRGELGLRGKRSIYGGEDARRRDGGNGVL